MNKVELIKRVAEKAELSQKDAAVAVDALVEVVAEALKAGDKVAIANFASFELKEKPARQGFNPITKQPITIAASKAPVCKFGKAFKDLFN
ncbi:MAG: HU family DNA-binding protein [Clostridia bacterium]|nr:HU family DNA-binding protein [Clostridia bacterium]